MLITLQNRYNEEEMLECLREVLHLFKARYQISYYRAIQLELTLVDAQGMDVELVDQHSDTPYRHFKFCESHSLTGTAPILRLVVDNTR
ncbi:MAG: hypothetical protein JJT82_02295 [Legionellaceae bacterium]|nr:hypothetical protein [Legionellaceae bacterium]